LESIGSKTALVIDAADDVQALLGSFFDSSGWQVRSAVTNEAALGLVASDAFGVVLTGEKMGGAENIDLLRKIHRVHPHARVILLAARSTPEDVIAAMREHAFGYFGRPFPADDLCSAVQAAMDQPCWVDGVELLSAKPSWIHLFARCDLQTAERVVRFLREVGTDLPERVARSLFDAFREMLMNAIEHGGRFDPSEYVEISYLHSGRAVSCRIRDPGSGFSPDNIPHAAIANPPDSPLRHLDFREARNLRPGGYGVLLARQLVDEVIYGEQGNEVILVKYMDEPTVA